MTENFWILIAVVILVTTFFAGRWTIKYGRLSKTGRDLPQDSTFTVIYHDKKRTILVENNAAGDEWLVSSQVFRGRPIKKGDIVRHPRTLEEWETIGHSQSFIPLIKIEKYDEDQLSPKLIGTDYNSH